MFQKLFNRMFKSGALDKQESELAYWEGRRAAEGVLSNDHFRRFYTEQFGLSPEDYRDKRVLDVGCGPRGSLEWASMAKERVGLDPLADSYLKLGADRHSMRYVAAGAEQMPFDADSFDIVCSFNSLDHVDDLDQAIASIVRVVAPGGLFLLLTDLHEEPTPCEPVVFSWDIVDRFQPALELLEVHHWEKNAGGLYESVDQRVAFDHSNPEQRYGVLSAKFRKPDA